MFEIDLNSDLGESLGAWSMGDDRAMLDIVTSANIACGGHAGKICILVDADAVPCDASACFVQHDRPCESFP